MIQIIERVPEEKRGASLTAVLEKCRAKADEIAFLICEIDEAVRFHDRATALRKADELLKIKPAHHRALKVQEEFAGYGDGGAARLGPLRQFTQPWNEGGWIPWSVLAFGLAIFGVMTGVVIFLLGRTVVVIDAKDPGIKVEVKGQAALITVPGRQPIKVEPGDQLLTVSSDGFESQTKSFSIKRGETKILDVGIVDKELVARFENEVLEPATGPDKKKLARKGVEKASDDKLQKTLAMARPGKASETKKGLAAPQGPRPELLVAPFDEAAALTARRQWAGYLNEPEELTNTIGMKLMLIPPGEFPIGSPDADQLAKEQERPQHQVRITRPFYLAAHEVTRGEFANFVSSSGYQTEAERSGGKAGGFDSRGDLGVVYNAGWKKPGFEQDDSHPVVVVSWNDAMAFCRWLNKKEGRSYRLPTEAEWEYACRAGTTSERYIGDKLVDLPKIGNFADTKAKFSEWPAVNVSDGYVYTSPVGQFRPNSFGLYDMLGNAMEWCSDWHDKDYYKTSPVNDPPGAAAGKSRTVRGGSFTNFAEASSRWYKMPDHRFPDCGFRVVCEIPADPTAAATMPATLSATGPATVAAISPPAKPAGPAKRSADRTAAESLQSLGATVTIRLGSSEQTIRPGMALPARPYQLARVNLSHNAQVTDAALESLRGLADLVELDLSKSPRITDAGLEQIGNLHSLEELHLSETSVGDAGLADLERLAQLKNLTLGKTQVTDAGLAHLRGLTKLETLWLHETSVGDAGLQHLCGLSELHSLLLWATNVTDAGLVHLEPLQRLEGLMLSGREVGDPGVAHLKSLKQLKTLWLTDTNLTDAGLSPLLALSHLRELNLRGSHITDAGLTPLQGLKGLKKLGLDGTKVSAAGVEKLKHSLPACQINAESAR